MSEPTREYTPVRGERSGITLVPNALGLRRGDRIKLAGRRAVVTHTDDCTLTVAWRDAWYWRAWWVVLDVWGWITHDEGRLRAAIGLMWCAALLALALYFRGH